MKCDEEKWDQSKTNGMRGNGRGNGRRNVESERGGECIERRGKKEKKSCVLLLF